MTSKWIKGGRIEDAETVIRFILAGEPIFDGHKLQNAGWTQNWSVNQIKRAVSLQRLHIALPAHIARKSEAA